MTIAPVDPDAYGAWGPASGSGGAQPAGAATPSKRLAFRVSMAPTAAAGSAPHGRIGFWLREVGEGTGGTPGGGQAAQPDAVRFVPDQANLVMDGENPRHAYTRDGLTPSEFTVEVEALRPDAHGLLQATCDDLHLIAEYEATGGIGIAIPREDAAPPWR
jgi:hypothetical protein